MRALVTGSAGFVGSYLCPRLESSGYQVTRVDPVETNDPVAFRAWRQRPSSNKERYDVIVHLGANILDVDTRSRAGVNVYEDLAIDYDVCAYVQEHPPTKCFVAMSSCATDFPDDCYGWIKLTLEKFCARLHQQNIPVVILRPFSGYGHDQKLSYPFPAILHRALNREDPLTVWGGQQIRDWIHIVDLIDGMIWAMDHAPRGVPVQLGTGRGVTFFELAQKMAEAVGYAPKIVGDTTKAVASLRRIADPQLARSLGWETKISLEEGIRRSVNALSAKDR
jgi:nucleoside-diphosphate-sugar epimerase